MTTEPEEPASGGKWTPGWWRAHVAPYGFDVFAHEPEKISGVSPWISSVTTSAMGDQRGCPSKDQCEANARLIAAAPDLAEAAGPLAARAADVLSHWPDECGVTVPLGELRALRTALLRARGGDHAG